MARVFCALFALVGTLPVAATALARLSAVSAWAARESTALLAKQGIQASYAIEVKLLPLALELTHVRVDSTDGGLPALVADRVSARPKLFALLAGKLVIDQSRSTRPPSAS